MKKILYSFLVMFGITGVVACSDMLEADSSRQLFDPEINQKTDSVTYAYGVLQAVQQLADQYYFQNEIRGDLVTTTAKASTHLQELASFSAGASNKYDSVYLYYKVINNCNYYLAHRDTTLKTGVRPVTSNEYAAIASIRAWTYLQMSRQYGAVPYITYPVTTIAQINANTEKTDYTTILASEAAMLESIKSRYSEEEYSVPTFGTSSRSVGRLNWKDSNGSTQNKSINPSKCFIPLNVVLGDLYLELGEYEKAASCYYQYLHYEGLKDVDNISVGYAYAHCREVSRSGVKAIEFKNYNYSPVFKNFIQLPVNYQNNMIQNYLDYINLDGDWLESFQHDASPGDVISYIPMAVNYTMGKTTEIPAVFGYDYYGSDNTSIVDVGTKIGFGCPTTTDLQVVPSQVYCDSARKAPYYYFAEFNTSTSLWTINSEPLGDARAGILSQGQGNDASYVYAYKPSTAYIPLYRNTTVWLHLAEAINRMGYPDAAFAVLKNGLHTDLAEYKYDETSSHTTDEYYLTPESYQLLTTKLPFLADANKTIFANTTKVHFVGIHFHGAGAVMDLTSPYKYKTVVETKIADISDKFGLGLVSGSYTKDDYINAVEDLLCDEYAMEFAFEGTRYSDLLRLARHKNQAGLYGGNFGYEWMGKKLADRGWSQANMYLPFE